MGDLGSFYFNLLFNKGKEISEKNRNLPSENHFKVLDSKKMDCWKILVRYI